MMTQYSILFSPTGGTARAAEILAAGLGGDWRQVDLCRAGETAALTAEDLCLVAVPSYGGRVPGLAAERLRGLNGNGAKAVLVCVYGNRAFEDTLSELQDILDERGFRCCAAVAAVAEHSIFRQYGASRPDGQDRAELTAFAVQIKAALDGPGKLTVPGSHGTYKEVKPNPMKPVGDERCVACGVCAAGCPAGAIPEEDPKRTDPDKCVSCMRCVALCPTGARGFDPEMLAAKAAVLAEALGGRKENSLYL